MPKCTKNINVNQPDEISDACSGSLTRDLARFCREMKFESFSEEQIKTLKFLLLDFIFRIKFGRF